MGLLGKEDCILEGVGEYTDTRLERPQAFVLDAEIPWKIPSLKRVHIKQSYQ
jgi:hypothetical protein